MAKYQKSNRQLVTLAKGRAFATQGLFALCRYKFKGKRITTYVEEAKRFVKDTDYQCDQIVRIFAT